jgi:AraC-like DNA-binding protein
MVQVTSGFASCLDPAGSGTVSEGVLQDEAMADLEKHDTRVPRGMIDPAGTAQRIRVARHKPSLHLAPFVDNIWIIEWDLTGRPPEVQKVLPAPNANLVIGAGQAKLFGVIRGVHGRSLEGTGRVVGLRFRTGGVRPFLGEAVATLTDRTVPAKIVTGIEDRAAEAQVLSAGDHGAMIRAIEAILHPQLPQPDPAVDLVCSIIERARRENGPQQAEALAREVGLSVRTMQRLFREYVGVSPKWVIRRYRLQEAAWRLAQGTNEPLAELAASLGYFDQAHLARDFTQLFGCPPSEYQKIQLS